jgi:predicted TIM-barrel fold metal-dependent hydrolase
MHRWRRRVRFLDRLPVSAADKERIAHGNAERLLKLI